MLLLLNFLRALLLVISKVLIVNLVYGSSFLVSDLSMQF